MSKKIECPRCGNTTNFQEDIWGEAQTLYHLWDEEKQAYKYQRFESWGHDGGTLTCGECLKGLPDLYNQFLECSVY